MRLKILAKSHQIMDQPAKRWKNASDFCCFLLFFSERGFPQWIEKFVIPWDQSWHSEVVWTKNQENLTCGCWVVPQRGSWIFVEDCNECLSYVRLLFSMRTAALKPFLFSRFRSSSRSPNHRTDDNGRNHRSWSTCRRSCHFMQSPLLRQKVTPREPKSFKAIHILKSSKPWQKLKEL